MAKAKNKWDALQARLEEQRARLQRDLENARAIRQATLAPPDEPTYSNHMADEGTLTYQQEENLAVERHLTRELDAVEAALARIREGTYGRCEECGKPIDWERLVALPAASLCIACKNRQAARR